MPRPEPLFSAPGRVFRVLATASAIALVAAAAASPPAGAKLRQCAERTGTSTSVAALSRGHAVEDSRAVTLLFLPGPTRSPAPLLSRDLDRLNGFATGMFSPTIGRYTPAQMMLDISQGARVASSLYRPVALASPGLVRDPDSRAGEIAGWEVVVRRAADTPSEIVPGTLAGVLHVSGKHVAWAGVEGNSPVTAIAAASAAPLPAESGLACGGIERTELSDVISSAATIASLESRFDLVVGALPAGGAGLSATEQLARKRPDRLYIVMQAPPDPAKTRLLPVAIRGLPGTGGGLRSASTRRAGLISATDIAPTILDRIGVEEPSQVQGQQIERSKHLTPDQLIAMSDRLSLVAGRRLPFGKGAVTITLLLVVVVMLLGQLAGRREEVSRTLLRVIALGILWLPLMLLVTAGLNPASKGEQHIAIGGSLVLALLTDRLVRWPRAPWVPVTAVLLAHGFDFAVLNSQYTGQSLLGSNPLYGARFFGVGNELEAVIGVSALIAVGAFMCDRLAPVAWKAFAAGGVVLALYLGIGRIGADVGGVVTVVAGFGVAALYAARLRLTPLRVAALIALPAVALALIVGLDAISGGESHLTRTVLKADGAGDFFTILDRRLRASVEGASQDGIWLVVILSALLLAWGWIRRERLTARLAEGGEDPASRRPYRAALAGAMSATVIGAAANDSGPAILIIGTIYLLMGLLYLRGRPLRV